MESLMFVLPHCATDATVSTALSTGAAARAGSCLFQAGVDYGKGGRDHFTGLRTKEECCAACLARPTCAVATFDSLSGYCWFKGKAARDRPPKRASNHLVSCLTERAQEVVQPAAAAVLLANDTSSRMRQKITNGSFMRNAHGLTARTQEAEQSAAAVLPSSDTSYTSSSSFNALRRKKPHRLSIPEFAATRAPAGSPSLSPGKVSLRTTNTSLMRDAHVASAEAPYCAAQHLHLAQPETFDTEMLLQALGTGLGGSIPTESRSVPALRYILKYLKPPLLASSRSHTGSLQHAKRLIGQMHQVIDEAGRRSPLRVLVLGGSVVAGSGCIDPEGDNTPTRQALVHSNATYPHRNIPCAWPARFERLVNQIVGWKALDVRSYAIGGLSTRSAVAAFINTHKSPWADPPDILIHAFSTNDMSPLFLTGSRATSTAEMERARQRHLEDFIRAVQKQCSPPLLLLLNDVSVLPHATTVSASPDGNPVPDFGSRLMHDLAAHYGLFFIDYGSMVRPHVLAQPQEQVFGPLWNASRKTPFQHHPTWTAHAAIALTLAYNVAHAFIDSCQQHVEAEGGKHGRTSLPPRLFSQSLEGALPNTTGMDDCSRVRQHACPVFWDGGTDGSNLPQLTRAMVRGSEHGWICDGDHGKWGWQARFAGASITFTLDLGESPNSRANLSRTLTLIYMSSYGEEWGMVGVDIQFNATHVGTDAVGQVAYAVADRLDGQGDRSIAASVLNSVSYPVPRDASTVSCRFILETGRTFKIMGMSVCED